MSTFQNDRGLAGLQRAQQELFGCVRTGDDEDGHFVGVARRVLKECGGGGGPCGFGDDVFLDHQVPHGTEHFFFADQYEFIDQGGDFAHVFFRRFADGQAVGDGVAELGGKSVALRKGERVGGSVRRLHAYDFNFGAELFGGKGHAANQGTVTHRNENHIGARELVENFAGDGG